MRCYIIANDTAVIKKLKITKKLKSSFYLVIEDDSYQNKRMFYPLETDSFIALSKYSNVYLNQLGVDIQPPPIDCTLPLIAEIGKIKFKRVDVDEDDEEIDGDPISLINKLSIESEKEKDRDIFI